MALAQRKRRKKHALKIVSRREREGLDEVYDRVRVQVRVVNQHGLVEVGTPTKTITVEGVRVSEVWDRIISAIERIG